jgi:hypothetical protein
MQVNKEMLNLLDSFSPFLGPKGQNITTFVRSFASMVETDSGKKTIDALSYLKNKGSKKEELAKDTSDYCTINSCSVDTCSADSCVAPGSNLDLKQIWEEYGLYIILLALLAIYLFSKDGEKLINKFIMFKLFNQ